MFGRLGPGVWGVWVAGFFRGFVGFFYFFSFVFFLFFRNGRLGGFGWLGCLVFRSLDCFVLFSFALFRLLFCVAWFGGGGS